MGISFNKIPFWGSIPQIDGVNPPPSSDLKLICQLTDDKFECNTPMKYTSESMIKKLSQDNPSIKRILSSVNIPYSINMKSLSDLLVGHARDTQIIAEGIVKNLPFGLALKADLKSIKDAAYLHDIGKVFIPPEILNKNSSLSRNETEIMHKHSELGYELLKNTNINPKVLYLIRYHHQNAQKTGYPKVDSKFFADLDLQIVSIADKYSALTEKRPYKEPMSREQALTIIRSDVRQGKFNPLVFNALVSYTDENALSATIKTA